jgi:hypothetical protein
VQIRVNRDGLIASFLPSAVFGVQAARDLGRYLRVRDRQPQHETTVERGDEDVHPLWLAQNGALQRTASIS